MNFTNLRTKLVEHDGSYDVLIRLDDAFASEFGEEFIPSKFNTDSAAATALCEHIRSSFPDKKLRHARLLFHGLTLAALNLTTRDEHLAQNSQFLGLVSRYQPGAEPAANTAPLQDYTTKNGDTLWIIAAKFNTTAEDICTLNSLQNTSIDAGRRISVPQDFASIE